MFSLVGGVAVFAQLLALGVVLPGWFAPVFSVLIFGSAHFLLLRWLVGDGDKSE